MAEAFCGPGLKLEEGDFEEAAKNLGCDLAAIKAIAEVESSGHGFLKNQKPKILFESHWFGKLTDYKYNTSHPHISTSKWTRNYIGGAGEYDRLNEAIKLKREAALKSASWGRFQILGINHKLAGFSNVEDFVQAHVKSESEHLKAVVHFIKNKKLDDELRDLRWADFARVYNGSSYQKNRYDEKMALAYEKHSNGLITPTTLDVQLALNRHGFSLETDGKTGPKTRAAIMAFQTSAGLVADGIVGTQTCAALGLYETDDPLVTSGNINA